MTKPGYTTTEFWVTVLTHLLAVVAIVHPSLPTERLTPIAQGLAVIAAAIAARAYAHSRSVVKVAVDNTGLSPNELSTAELLATVQTRLAQLERK